MCLKHKSLTDQVDLKILFSRFFSPSVLHNIINKCIFYNFLNIIYKIKTICGFICKRFRIRILTGDDWKEGFAEGRFLGG